MIKAAAVVVIALVGYGAGAIVVAAMGRVAHWFIGRTPPE